MKKKYIQPEMNVERVLGEQMLSVSGVRSISDDVNIGYGGVDTNGDKEADVKGNPFGESMLTLIESFPSIGSSLNAELLNRAPSL